MGIYCTICLFERNGFRRTELSNYGQATSKEDLINILMADQQAVDFSVISSAFATALLKIC